MAFLSEGHEQGKWRTGKQFAQCPVAMGTVPSTFFFFFFLITKEITKPEDGGNPSNLRPDKQHTQPLFKERQLSQLLSPHSHGLGSPGDP